MTLPKPTVAPSESAMAMFAESAVAWKRPFVCAVPPSPPACVSPETVASVAVALNESRPIPRKTVFAFASMALSALIVTKPEPVIAPFSFASTEPATTAFVSTAPSEIPPRPPP